MTEDRKSKYHKNVCSDCNRFIEIRNQKLNLCKTCLRRYKQLQAPKIYCADGCGQLIPSIDRHGRPCKYKIGHGNRTISKGLPDGKSMSSKGYINSKDPSHKFATKRGVVRDHRLSYEEYNKCCLLPWSVVHHKDGDKTNNGGSNLEAFFSNGKHMRETYRKDTSGRFCADCGTNNTKKNKKGVKIWYEIYMSIWLCKKCGDRFFYLLRKSVKNSKIQPLRTGQKPEIHG